MKFPTYKIGTAWVRAGVVWTALTPFASAELYLNEIYFDPPGSGDINLEYIELRGASNMPLDNHYLIFIENEDVSAGTGAAGEIDHIFDLSGKTVGDNGFLTLRQKDSPYANIASGTSDYKNMGSLFGWGTNSTNNTIGFTSTGVLIENSGWTAMLIRNDGDPDSNRPALGLDLDVGNNGLDHPSGHEGWAILDAIGVSSELDETEFGRLYVPINFGHVDEFFPPDFQANIEPGATFVGLEYELEYVGRWGNSTGQAADDWHVSNLTDNSLAGFTNQRDYRQSGHLHDPVPSDFVETNQEVPYGVNLTGTLGAPNYLHGDYNGNGYVDAADYTVWRNMQTRLAVDLAADGNNDSVVNADDFAVWSRRFGQPGSPDMWRNGNRDSTAVPEPASIALAIIALLAMSRRVAEGRPKNNVPS